MAVRVFEKSSVTSGLPPRLTSRRARLLTAATAAGALVVAPLAMVTPASAAASTSATASAAGGFFAVASHRIADTATSVGISKGTLKAGSWHVVTVAGKGGCPRAPARRCSPSR